MGLEDGAGQLFDNGPHGVRLVVDRHDNRDLRSRGLRGRRLELHRFHARSRRMRSSVGVEPLCVARYQSIVDSRPSRKETLGSQPSSSRAFRMSKARLTAPVGFDVSKKISRGRHPTRSKIVFATSIIVYRRPLPRLTALPSVMRSAARTVPSTMSVTYVKSRSWRPLPQIGYGSIRRTAL